MKVNLFLPSDDVETIEYKNRFWQFSVPGPFVIFLFGVILWLLDAKEMGICMVIFAVVQLCILVAFIIVKKHAQWFAAITFYFFVLSSFIITLLFGGILSSGGVTFVGLAGALNSLLFLSIRQFRTLFGIYLLTLIISAISQPFLMPIAILPPTINLVLFVCHIFVIAIAMYNTISYYIEISIKAKESEAERLKEVDKMKTHFYTNITHEFRTPLTVILGMADQIACKPKEFLNTGVRMIKKNGIKLLNLVNQMLDLSKLESGTKFLKNTQSDIVIFIRYVIETFEKLANEKNINFHFSTDEEEILMDFDPDAIESLLSNLLSNAIKFSSKGDTILMHIDICNEVEIPDQRHFILFGYDKVKKAGKRLMIKITDSGQGIPTDKMNQIFDRYFQINEDLSNGSGIGLSLVKEYLLLMKGDLILTSSTVKGTSFTIYLPVTNKETLSYDFDLYHDSPIVDEHSQLSERIYHEAPKNKKSAHLLIIEDNNDVTEYIRSVLNDTFNIDAVQNGNAGIKKAQESIPDIILSDIMMPEKNGFQVCEILKNDFRTSHIPIVLLTAKADIESKISGLEKGADAYLVKPFNSKELKVRLQKLIEIREKLKQKYLHLAIHDSLPLVPENSEEEFLERIKNIMEDNLDKEDFDTNQMSRILGVSRTQLFRKLKAVIGVSASTFIRSYRLIRAQGLIVNTQINMSEIAYEVGFKDPAYFTRAFTKEFGVTPSQFRSSRVKK